MKRHPSLVPFSKEHHNALLLAQLLKTSAPDYKGLPTTLEGKIKYALKLFDSVLINHFAAEEKLLQLASNFHADINILTDEIIYEHKQLTSLFTNLKNVRVTYTELDELGCLLEVHIRKEERVLFPLLEKHCSSQILSEWNYLNE